MSQGPSSTPPKIQSVNKPGTENELHLLFGCLEATMSELRRSVDELELDLFASR